MLFKTDLLKFSTTLKKKFLYLLNSNDSLHYFLIEKTAFAEGEPKKIAKDLNLSIS